jgi:hypothetical protein
VYLRTVIGVSSMHSAVARPALPFNALFSGPFSENTVTRRLPVGLGAKGTLLAGRDPVLETVIRRP